MATIHFNGQVYDSPEAMPPEIRQLYEMAAGLLADKNQDGVPDIFAGNTGAVKATVFQTSQFIIDGKVYGSLDAVPAEARQRYQQALGQLDANQNGTPDFLEASQPAGTGAPASHPQQAPSQLPSLVQVVGEPAPLSRGALLLVGAVVALLLIGVVIYLLR